MKTNKFVPGNHTEKYDSRNPLKRYLVQNFLHNFGELAISTKLPKNATIAEVGCAEGALIKHLLALFPKADFSACDLDTNEVEKARKNTNGLTVEFSIQNAERLAKYKKASFDLVSCCEVLEHVENPEKALQELLRISRKYILVSVPNEPIWRILNFVTGKYIKNWGNTPGHLNHWSKSSFRSFLYAGNAKITVTKYPLPWQMYLLKVD